MGVDVEIHGSIVLILEGLENPEKVVAKIKKWIKRHPDDVYGWIFEYSHHGDQIDISFENPKRGALMGYITGISKFLKFCLKYGLYAEDALSYIETWGDYAAGSVWISSERKVSIIRGMTNLGDPVDETINWANI
jgi:hypothetical protein